MNALDELKIPLNRPQYVPSPEVLVSSLIHRHFDNPEKPKGAKGYRFLGADEAKSTETTGPQTPAEMEAFGQLLQISGLRTDLPDPRQLAEAVIGGVKGVRPTKSKAIPVSPMTTNLALAQDMGGVLGTANPPAMGSVLEVMYQLGRAPDSDESFGMGHRWLTATEFRMSQDPVLSVVDKAAGQMGIIQGFVRKEVGPPAGSEGWVSRFSEASPFSWLYRSWDRLTSPEWVTALPARIWTDWATMVLRTALGFGFLWESRWYESIGSMLLDTQPVTHLPQMQERPLLSWLPSRLPIATRNIRGEIEQTVSKGLEVQRVLEESLKSNERSGTTLEVMESLRTNRAVRDKIREGMSGRARERRLRNTYETIVYALQQRSTVAAATDYYGLLRQRGTRYLVVAPGTEWMAVVASLACEHPGQETHVGAVVRSLEELGLRPELHEVVKLLEAAGLAEGSPDADHGVRVRSAF